ncbi:hypothetical protein PHYSODRAFT_523199 [Plasmopara halstedii]|uniref:Uncharacterized protein n=1 Tax=Plasmopara halstedii TaxID=4781 RepID=A0A0N7L5E6_PLAHL|nr:hypothetical protein PHYSODRAFT_523199 [Plasmopara halstedii]CEG41259.1 hypothetical protein PHYSODRAFT_523199 [Plasmopara halstedii]|eukprot:XP_024577628.1 hypothetical protein PHYSODRAFT_523199 [Plasmopara halstedii]
MAKITNFMRVTKQPRAHGKKIDTDEEPEGHIPVFIYEFVKYKAKHEKHETSKKLKTIVEYIKKHYDVPKDFEVNAKFGCHSGLTFEKRLTRAYLMGQLDLKHEKKGGAMPKPICLTCATVGHTYKTCPDGF